MIITAKASTIRSAAKRAGYDKAITIRVGHRAAGQFGGYVDPYTECNVLIAVMEPGVEEFFDSLAAKYGTRN